VLSATVRSATDDELSFIAGLDYGEGRAQHLAALLTVVREQAGIFRPDQYWHPYEVVELGAHSLTPGHEREFAICTLLVIQAVVSGYDTSTVLADKFCERAADYESLPADLREEILGAYLEAESRALLGEVWRG
jgi:hypothetical protein